MRRFAQLYTELDQTNSQLTKRAAMVAYFREVSAADAAWAMYVLSGGRVRQIVKRGELRTWLSEWLEMPDWLIRESRAHVGDLAETLALLADAEHTPFSHMPDLPLHVVIEDHLLPLKSADDAEKQCVIVNFWRDLPFDQRLAFNKLLTGALRVGVSKRSAQQALAAAFELDMAKVVQRMMGKWQPSAANFARLTSTDDLPEDALQPYPFFLASPLESSPAEALGDVSDWLIEWKWDGIRMQLLKRAGKVALWSRGEERLDGRYPEIEAAAAALPDDVVVDGELLAYSDGRVLPFSRLQTRINRLKPSAKAMADAPLVMIAYDLLEYNGEDWRDRPLAERRAKLETLLAETNQAALMISPLAQPEDWQQAAVMRNTSRERGVEGFMLKRATSTYQEGRRRGDWWKWKVDPYTIDAVLMYAQPGSGRRATLMTDYTFGLWNGDTLVPVAKAYSGLDQQEIQTLDKWVRQHTTERFGPVRAVEVAHVFEIAFEGVALSKRHKSGVATRFPRIARWRSDKKPKDADCLETLQALAAQG